MNLPEIDENATIEFDCKLICTRRTGNVPSVVMTSLEDYQELVKALKLQVIKVGHALKSPSKGSVVFEIQGPDVVFWQRAAKAAEEM